MSENRKALFGLLGLIIIGSLMLIYLPKSTSASFKQTRLLLDTYVTIIVDAPQKVAKPATDSAFKRMSQIEKKLNRYDERSEIARINKSAPKPVAVSADTYNAVKLALSYSKITGGKFDITVGPLVDLFNFAKKVVPTKAQVYKAKRLVDWRLVKMDDKLRTISLVKEGMVLDLGGMAKGIAADEANKVLIKHGVRNGLIDTGSSTLAFSSKGGRVWKIGLRHPREDEILTVFKVQNRRLSTSGDYQQYFIKSGRRYHHIINPQTGYPAKGLVSVTIISSKTAAESDILSTAVFAMGPETGLRFVSKFTDTEAVLIDANGKVKVTDTKVAKLPAKININWK